MRLRAATLAILAVLAPGAVARAADFMVTTTADSGAGSLRQAIIDSNASTLGPNRIIFGAAILNNATISLATPLDNITTPTLTFEHSVPGRILTIDGPGASTNFVTFTTSSTAANFNHMNSTFTDGILTFDESDTGTIVGTLRGGTLTVAKTGAGTTTLPVASSINLTATSSQLRIDQGTFAANGTVTTGTLSVAAPAILDVAGTVNVTSAAGLTDNGTVRVATGGVLSSPSLLVASGATLDITGTATVNGTLTNRGTVDVDGTLNSGTLIVDPNSILTGLGTVTAAQQVTVSGRVAPSTTTGTFTINGPVNFGPSSTFEANIEPGNMGDALVVAGAVNIQPGAQLALVADPSSIAGTSQKTVLTASNITGEFTATDYAFFQETLLYQRDPDPLVPDFLTVTLSSTGQNFASFAGTPNQQAVAGVLDAAIPTATGDLQTVFDSLETALATEIAPLLDAIGGESLTAFATARQMLGERTARAIHRRSRDPGRGEGWAFYRPEDHDVAAQGDERPLIDRVRPSAWVDGLGLFGQLDGDTGEADVDALLYGATLGADATIAEQFVVGLAAGYARSDVDLDHREADVYGDTVQGALYAGFVDPRGYVSGYGRYAYTFQDSTRRIESSTLSRRAKADWDAQDYGAGVEAGVTLASYRGFAFQPIAGVDWLRLTEESYTESGAGSLNLIVDPETLETTAARFGGRVFGRVDMGDPGVLVPELRAFYQHLSGDRERALEATLVGTPGLTSIGVRGAELPRDNLLLGIGWNVLVGQQLSVSFDYDAVLGSDRVDHQGTVAARVLF
jgi:uncharacterized protein with beta-barrel porin domain